MFKFWRPKLGDQLLKEGYSLVRLRQDLIAGFILAILALPMSISFAISSGVRPEQGLYTAIIGGFVIALLGGSAYQVSGPTGAFVVLIYSIVHQYGYEGLAVAALIAGVFILIMGLLKLGQFIQFVPYPVVIGMTSGLAFVIFIGQVPDFLGLKIPNFPPDFIHRIAAIGKYAFTANFYTLGIGLLTLIFPILSKKINPKIPGALIAIFSATLLVFFFKIPIATIGSRFGAISSALPALNFPWVSFDTFLSLISPALSIALLASMESLLSALVADGMTETKHCPNTELVALGLGNITSILFGGIPATAGFARTMANVKNGAQTPLSAIFHALFLLMILLFFGEFMIYIPIASLSALLFIVCYNMSEWRHFSKLFLSPKSDILVLLTTFVLTIFVGLTFAIQAGVVLAVFLFAHHMVKASNGKFFKDKSEDETKEDPWSIHLREVPEEIDVFEIQGPFFFAAVEKFKSSLFQNSQHPQILILRLRHVPFIDATAIRALEDILSFCQKQKILLLCSGVNKRVMALLKKNGFYKKIEEEHIFSNIDEALSFAKSKVVKPVTNPILAVEEPMPSETLVVEATILEQTPTPILTIEASFAKPEDKKSLS